MIQLIRQLRMKIKKTVPVKGDITGPGIVAHMSHELRTPLSSILLYADLLRQEAEDRGDTHTIAELDGLQGAGEHMKGILDQVLELVRIEAGATTLVLEPTHVGALMKDVCAITGPVVQKNYNTFHIRSSVKDEILTDRMKLRQVLVNLVGNAAKFTNHGVVTLESKSEERGVRFSVSDTGIGMSEEQLRRLYRPFQQADAHAYRQFGGAGLGLSISKQLCDLLGGTISVTSHLGLGTEFTLFIPSMVNPHL